MEPVYVNFYSTAKYEKKLNEKYEFEVKKKQDEIDEIQRRTKKIQKFTARAHIPKPERVFYIYNRIAYCDKIDDKNICPINLVEGGAGYVLDVEEESKYAKLAEFVNKCRNYKITFYPDGRYGPTTCYCTKINAIPAKLESIEGDYELILDDEDKYDICVA
jgi:hypothetical protein